MVASRNVRSTNRESDQFNVLVPNALQVSILFAYISNAFQPNEFQSQSPLRKYWIILPWMHDSIARLALHGPVDHFFDDHLRAVTAADADGVSIAFATIRHPRLDVV